jgi:hypothetical protein
VLDYAKRIGNPANGGYRGQADARNGEDNLPGVQSRAAKQE